jgi:glutathione S-transferase
VKFTGSLALTRAVQDDDGFILFESLAIARYVAVRASSPLLPRGDGRAAARFEQALSVESSNFDPYVETIVFQRVFGPDWGKPTNEPRVQAAAQALEGKLQGYERILAAQRYLAGDEVTLADLIHLPWGVYLAPQGFGWLEDAGMYPNVARYVVQGNHPEGGAELVFRWWADINAHPAWKEVERMVRSMDATYDQTRKPRV